MRASFECRFGRHAGLNIDQMVSRLQRGDEDHLDKDWIINVVRYDDNYWVLNNRHFSALARCAELKFDSNGNPKDSKRVIRTTKV